MKDEIFVVSDIHGCYDELLELLRNWNTETQELVLAGDLVDRGKQSKEVLLFAQQVMLEGKGTVLRGNHDQMFLDFLTQSAHDVGDIFPVWYYQGGRETTQSILGEDVYVEYREDAVILRDRFEKYSYVRDVLELTVPYYEFGDVLVVHAGVPAYYEKNWKRATQEELIWHRGHWNHPNKTGKILVSGHTPTTTIHDDPNNHQVWLNKAEDIIMIDGACAYGGVLNGVVMNKEGRILQTYSIPSKKRT